MLRRSTQLNFENTQQILDNDAPSKTTIRPWMSFKDEEPPGPLLHDTIPEMVRKLYTVVLRDPTPKLEEIV